MAQGGVQHCTGNRSGADGTGPLGNESSGTVLGPSKFASISRLAPGVRHRVLGWFYGETPFLGRGAGGGANRGAVNVRDKELAGGGVWETSLVAGGGKGSPGSMGRSDKGGAILLEIQGLDLASLLYRP